MIANRFNPLGKRFGKPTARDYIQNGLILHFDALENGGFGIHDENATEWVDLSGYGRNATIRKLVEGDYKPFKEDHCLVEGTKFILQVNGFNMNEVLTQAFCLSVIEKTQSFPRIIAENAGFVLFSQHFWFYGYQLDQAIYPQMPCVLGRPTSIAMSLDTEKVFYQNSVEKRRISGSAKAITTNTIYFGGRTDGNRQGTFKYHNIQLYNRPLSQEEIAYNDSIHRERFGFAL